MTREETGMSISDSEALKVTAGTTTEAAQKVTAIVGFDGSEPSRRALASASRLLAGRAGEIEVVYVAEPIDGPLSGVVAWQMDNAFEESDDLRVEADRLLGHEQAWTFHRGEGDIAQSLMAEAENQANVDERSQVIIVVGASAHRDHKWIGSVPALLVDHVRVPVIMVP
jgi:nucleotide-binding universal stress UspA family protein